MCLVLSIPLGVAVFFTGEVLLSFVFFWPLFMAAMWITGGLYFWFYRERRWPWGEEVPPPESVDAVRPSAPCAEVTAAVRCAEAMCASSSVTATLG